MRETKEKMDAREILGAASVTLLLSLCVVPAFCSIGHLLFQLLSSFFLPLAAAAFTRLTCARYYRTAEIVLCAYLAIFTLIAVIVQAAAQIRCGTLAYRYTFYYDKPLCVLVAWFSFFFFFLLAYLFDQSPLLPFDPMPVDFKRMVKRGGTAFLIAYTLLLVYFFVYMRWGVPVVDLAGNMVPFATIRFYLTTGDFYENFMYLFGNLALLAPCGFLLRLMWRRFPIPLSFFLPILISVGIEYTQAHFQMGMPDIDDLLLNCIGYYLGVMLCRILRRIHRIYAHGSRKPLI